MESRKSRFRGAGRNENREREELFGILPENHYLCNKALAAALLFLLPITSTRSDHIPLAKHPASLVETVTN
jgi:hypothetical protein